MKRYLTLGDLWYGNTLWDDGNLTAVLDWDCAGHGAGRNPSRLAPGSDFLAFTGPSVGHWISDSGTIWTTRDGGRPGYGWPRSGRPRCGCSARRRLR
jgi:hypothetical protein